MIDWKDVLLWAPSLLTVLGWGIVNRQNNLRELRKELRKAGDRCKALVLESTKLAFKYWSGEQGIRSWELKALLEELEIELERLSWKKIYQVEINIKYISLLDTITGYDFESINFKGYSKDHPVFKEITITRQQLLKEIENCLRH